VSVLIELGKINDAVRLPKAFIRQVEAQSGKSITTEAAQALIEAAQAVIESLQIITKFQALCNFPPHSAQNFAVSEFNGPSNPL
jgi:hypothetical protein